MSSMIFDKISELAKCSSVDRAIELVASSFVRDAKCFRAPIDLVKLGESLGIVSVRLARLACDGLLIPNNDGSYQVLISEDAPIARQRFSFAHELAHVILHRLVPETRSFEGRNLFLVPGNKPEESLCDAIAASLLMPEEMILEDAVGASKSLATIRSISGKYGVSLTAAALRVKSMGTEPDFAVVKLLNNTSEKLPSEVKCDVLANFNEAPLRRKTQQSIDEGSIVHKCLESRQSVSGWHWHREGLRRRYLHLTLDRPLRNSVIGIVKRRDR